MAQELPPGWGPPTNTPIASWSFSDNTNWTSDQGAFPISFTNLAYSCLGDFSSLVVDTNAPAWLNYYVYQPDTGATNLVANRPGSVTFWFGPDWSSADGGPGQWVQLLDVGEWTTNSSYGYWGLSVDQPGSNLWFVAQDGEGTTYALSTPISWTTNYFHFIALTYSSTNVSLYLDGQLATNDPGGLSIWPGSEVLSNGFYIGSDTNGAYQAHGSFNSLCTYNYPLDSNTVQQIYDYEYSWYIINPFNIIAMDIVSAPSSPSTSATTPDVITGAGDLQANGPVLAHYYGTSAYQVWMTNVTASAVSNGTTTISFTIEGGQDGYMYDVFATGALEIPLSDGVWYWMGQGGHFTNYSVSITSQNAFLVLGTPLDSDSDGLTDAYELLVSHTNPDSPDSNLDGLLDGWEILLGLNPTISNFTSPSQRSNYGYTPADWLNGVAGIRSGTITNDPEGNVLQVSQ